MPSRYTLIQYRPDPASDERLNIGVIAWDADGAHVVFVESWEHVRLFTGQDGVSSRICPVGADAPAGKDGADRR